MLYVLVLIGFDAREFALSHCRTLRVVTDMGRASWGQLPSTTMILPPTIRLAESSTYNTRPLGVLTLSHIAIPARFFLG